MRSRYHPLEEGLWDDPKFDAQAGRAEASFEERSFFAYLFSNHRQRPSGIYRATDGQLAEGSRLHLKRVASYLADLHRRSLIVRDGAWMFVPGYLKRQSKSPRLLLGAEKDVAACESVVILKKFAQLYPIYSRWSIDRLETIKQRSVMPVLEFVAQNQNQNQSTPPTPSRTVTRPSQEGPDCDGGFLVFWEAYPKKVGKGAARRVWLRLRPPQDLVERILSALARQRAWTQWQEDHGRYIPHPATWLHQERWADEPTEVASSLQMSDPPRTTPSPVPPDPAVQDRIAALAKGVVEKLGLPSQETQRRRSRK